MKLKEITDFGFLKNARIFYSKKSEKLDEPTLLISNNVSNSPHAYRMSSSPSLKEKYSLTF